MKEALFAAFFTRTLRADSPDDFERLCYTIDTYARATLNPCWLTFSAYVFRVALCGESAGRWGIAASGDGR